MRELLHESMCGFEGVPHLLCVDRKCCECGTACVGLKVFPISCVWTESVVNVEQLVWV